MKRIISFALCAVLLMGLTGPVFANRDFGGGFSHGSDTAVTEEQLLTEESIPEDYDVNPDTQGDAASGDYAVLFDKTKVQDVNIEIDENNWNYMLQNASDKPTVMTTSVTIGAHTVGYASIKTKGNLTLSSIWNSNSDRFSFTVNFGKYIKKKNGYSDNQTLFGLEKVALNNIYGDATLMKEYLSYELMTQMGVATPEYCLIKLHINGEFWGVYMMVESVDSALTERTLGEKSDLLLKPESLGGDLVYDTSLDEYYDEAAGSFDFSALLHPDGSEELVYPEGSNPLVPYCGLWENDPDTLADIEGSLPVLFKWLRALNRLNTAEEPNSADYETALAGIMDVDEVLRYFAANTFLVNLDSYQSEKMQNYTLFINDDGYMRILPWDYNFSFGTYGVTDAESMVNFSISDPVINTTLAQRPLLNVLLQNDALRQRYETYLADCCAIVCGGTTSDGRSYDEEHFSAIIDRYHDALSDDYSTDPTAFYTADQYDAATGALKELIGLRVEAVTRQLAGDETPVETDINMNTMGNSVGGMGELTTPGGGQSISETTLTDEATGITVTGMLFGTLTVTKLSEGDAAWPAGLDAGKTHTVYQISLSGGMTDILSGGIEQMPDGEQPQMPSEGMGGMLPDGEQPQIPSEGLGGMLPDGEQPQMPGEAMGGMMPDGEQPQMPSEGMGSMNPGSQPEMPGQSGDALDQLPDGMGGGKFPGEMGQVTQSYTLTFPVSDSTVTLSQIGSDGTVTTLMGSITNGILTVSTDSLGVFVLSQDKPSEEGTNWMLWAFVIGGLALAAGGCAVGIALGKKKKKA